MYMIYGYKSLKGVFYVATWWEPCIAGAFILISGISFQLSRNNVKRGLRLFAVAVLISVVVWIFIPEQMIWFGIIHFLAVSNIVLGLLKKYLDKIPFAPLTAVSSVLFLLTYNVQRGYLGIKGLWSFALPKWFYVTDLTMPFGFYTPGFHSSDYFPFLPWIFLFVIGTALGRYAEKLPESLAKPHIPALAFIGRHTLIIYLLHQPVIIGALELIRLLS